MKRARLKFKRSQVCSQIFFNDDLTEKSKKIFYELRKLKKSGEIAVCWSCDDGHLSFKLASGIIRSATRMMHIKLGISKETI